MPVTFLLQRLVAQPAVRVDHTAGLNRLFDERHQTGSRSIGNVAQTNAPNSLSILLSGNDNQGLHFHLTPPQTFFQSAQVSFVDFHGSRQAIATGPDHSPAQLMQPTPSRPVVLQSQDPLQTQGASTVLLGSHPPHSPKPQPQRTPGILKDCSCRRRSLMPTLDAFQEHLSHPPVPARSTASTAKSVRPSQAD